MSARIMIPALLAFAFTGGCDTSIPGFGSADLARHGQDDAVGHPHGGGVEPGEDNGGDDTGTHDTGIDDRANDGQDDGGHHGSGHQ
jgi:hypothetical protein